MASAPILPEHLVPSVTLSTGTVHYETIGNGAPLLLLHANPGDSADFEAVMPTLSASYRVLALDWPGYGRSAMPPAPDAVDTSQYLRVLDEFVTALKLPPVVCLGNSVGGLVATRFALEAPHSVRGLVLVAPGGFSPPSPMTRAFCALQASRFALSPRRFAGWYLRTPTPTVAAMRRRAATVQATPECLALNRALWRSFAKPENDLRQSARALTVPTLLLFGTGDPVIRARTDGRAAAAALPDATCRMLPCGHAPFAELPGPFLDAVLPFLAALPDA